MIIKDMFTKPIDRDIKGVIKVGQDDNVNIKQELEEYVVTRELQKHFADFFANYKNGITGNTDKMGVWISGFFGSGKSHFLKILSYLLANKEVAGKKAMEYFVDDKKVADAMVLADMKLAAQVPTDVVLFNIDSKSEVNGKQSKVAIVSVMQNVFNEMLGYSGSNPFLADLERRLDAEGKYQLFKDTFQEKFGNVWEEERSDFDFIQDDVVEVLAEIDFMSEEAGRNWCEKTTGEYSYKVEDFAKLVKDYIAQKGNNHHVVFLIDEIGQYIGEDSKLMLNLQTVTEDLGTTCKGKAWIIVTSQQDIDSVTKTKGNDFSKIQGRFDTRLALSSANVDEVIKKRILAKNETANQTLSILYETRETVIKNLILFNDGIEKKLYSSKENFAAVYPFIPYQFNLLGDVLTSIRIHGASGKHLAEGERSMLALFKESAVKIMHAEAGTLIPFNMFYDALEQFLDHSHRGVISRAWENEQLNPYKQEECFDVNVLKTLFMIKYVKEIKANLGNITSLMVSSVNDDRMALEKQVKDALNRLVKQTLVQKNGDVYVFLTDEEQEINREIQSQMIETGEITNKASEMIFDGLYDEKKYKHPALNGKYMFGFNQVLDSKPYKANQNYDITLKIVTPYSDEGGDESSMHMLSMQNSNAVLVVLPDKRDFLEELHGALQIERFLRLDNSNVVSKYAQIKEAKSVEAKEKLQHAQLLLAEALQNADLYINGDKIQKGSKEIKTRFNDALGKLVDRVYNKLNYINAVVTESDLRALLKNDSQQLTLDGRIDEKNKLALDEVLSFVSLNTQRHMPTSLKSLQDRFTRAPYGFTEVDVEWLVANLFRSSDLTLTVNNENVSLLSHTEKEIFNFLTKKEYTEKLMCSQRVKANEKQKKKVRSVMKELFNITPASDDDDAMMKSFIGYASDLKRSLDILESKYEANSTYPGKKVVLDGKVLLNGFLHMQNAGEFFKAVAEQEDDLLDLAEDLAPVKNFFAGKQREIFDKAITLVGIYENSKNYFVNAALEETVKAIILVLQMPKPYGRIHTLPDLINKFIGLYNDELDKTQEPVNIAIEEARKRVLAELENKKCHDLLVNKFVEAFQSIKDKAEKCDNVAVLQGIKMEVDALKVRCLDTITEEEAKLDSKFVKENPNDPQNQGKQGTATVVGKKVKHVSIKNVNTATTWRIETEADVNNYVEELKKKLMKELEENTIVNIEF